MYNSKADNSIFNPGFQSTLPLNGKPLGIILYSDRTKLSSFGTAKGYPVMAAISNFEADIRNGHGIGGGRVVGWEPIVNHQLLLLVY